MLFHVFRVYFYIIYANKRGKVQLVNLFNETAEKTIKVKFEQVFSSSSRLKTGIKFVHTNHHGTHTIESLPFFVPQNPHNRVFKTLCSSNNTIGLNKKWVFHIANKIQGTHLW